MYNILPMLVVNIIQYITSADIREFVETSLVYSIFKSFNLI